MVSVGPELAQMFGRAGPKGRRHPAGMSADRDAVPRVESTEPLWSETRKRGSWGRLCGAPDLVLLSIGLLPMHPVGDLLPLLRGGEDGSFVGTQPSSNQQEIII